MELGVPAPTSIAATSQSGYASTPRAYFCAAPWTCVPLTAAMARRGAACVYSPGPGAACNGA